MRPLLSCMSVLLIAFIPVSLSSSTTHAPVEGEYGDAPFPYPTLERDNGARHGYDPDVYMGALIDTEFDGQPDASAQGDDAIDLDDEDGVALVTPFFPGMSAQVDVNVSVDGWLAIWFDFAGDGSWLEAADQVYGGPVSAGLNMIPINVPAAATPGETFARFRFYSHEFAMDPDGPAPDGEVEDYQVTIGDPSEALDFGDAPDPWYPTLLASYGARHTVDPAVYMGMFIDADLDGQPDQWATGDDNTNLNDEDGVTFVTPLIPGSTAQVGVTVSADGWLDAWFDFNGNGSWFDAGDNVFNGPVYVGFNPIPFSLPATAAPGSTFARFRYNSQGPLPVDGPAPDGEVEDYKVAIGGLGYDYDFGDAPDPLYPTLLGSDGARHKIVPFVYMGSLIDADPDGQPDATATGDDTAGVPDDEDGVTFGSPLYVGFNNQVDVVTSVGGWLNVWIDFDQNGSWWDPGEEVFSGLVSGGYNPLVFAVPSTATPGITFARFRYSSVLIAMAVDGEAPDGEVEDYEVLIVEPLDFGDAPDGPYPTLLSSNGARHVIIPGTYMGAMIDPENDGLPDANALGDDNSGADDEDGVTFLTPFNPDSSAQVNVTVSMNGWVDAWFDFDGNGSWLDAGEQVFSGPVLAGSNPIVFVVPSTAAAGTTFARFRYNDIGSALAPDGPAAGGEVEDYEVLIEVPQVEMDFGDAPDLPYPTLLGSNGARHTIDPAVFMGATIDSEPDGQPGSYAVGDDTSGVPDDEDGVVFLTPFVPGAGAQVDVIVSVAGWLNVWFDFDGNGSWLGAGEEVYSGPVAAGANSIPFGVPAGAAPGVTFARFRYGLGGAMPVDGPWPEGEVEDYEVVIDETAGVNPGEGGRPRFALYDAVPNPFDLDTRLAFSLPSAGRVRVTIYDASGRLVRTLLDENRGPGPGAVVWDGRDDLRRRVTSGVYLYRIEAGGKTRMKRMVFTR